MHPIARHRKANGWTQTQLANRVGVTLNAVQKWEDGKGPRPANIPKLADVVGVAARELLDEIEAYRKRTAVPVLSLNDWTLDMETDEAAAPTPAAEDA